MKHKLNKQKGFTLIELLVVIAIISLLSSVVLASLKSAREKAMLSKTVSEMKSLQTAVEMYRNKFGVYPGVDGKVYADISDPSSDWSQWIDDGLGWGFVLSLEILQNTTLISNKFLSKPVLAPKQIETCDEYCITKGYELFYTPSKLFDGSNKFLCGGVPIKDYAIFLSANTKKINLPIFTMESIDSVVYNTGGLVGPIGEVNGDLPYVYCLAM